MRGRVILMRNEATANIKHLRRSFHDYRQKSRVAARHQPRQHQNGHLAPGPGTMPIEYSHAHSAESHFAGFQLRCFHVGV